MSNGTLPWRSVPNDEKNNYAGILNLKQTISTIELWRDLPPEFQIFHDYVLQLGNKSKIDYDYIQQLFDETAKNLGTSLLVSIRIQKKKILNIVFLLAKSTMIIDC